MSFIPGNTGVASTFPDGFELGDGTVTAPTLRFGDPQTGFYRAGSNSWSFAAAGVESWNISSTGAHTFGQANVTGTHNFYGQSVTISRAGDTYFEAARVTGGSQGKILIGGESGTAVLYSRTTGTTAAPLRFFAGTTQVGEHTATGAWTLGPSSGLTAPHLFRSSSTSWAAELRNTANDVGAYIGFSSSSGTARGQVGATTSNMFETYNGTGSVLGGSCSSTGTWTLGPSSGGAIHTIQSPGNGTGSAALHVRKQGVAINTSGNSYIECYGSSGGFDGYLGVSGTTLQVVDASDSRKKENVRAANYGLTQILALNPVLFDWKPEFGGEVDIKGFLAQEVELVLPECVTIKDESAYGGPADARYLGTAAMIPVLVKAIQELTARLEALEGAQP